MTDYFHAWRRRQASLQAAEWEEEQESARRLVDDVPPWRRSDVRRVIEALIDGPDSGLQDALAELDRLLEDDPELRARFFRLRIVDDANEFLQR